MRNGTKFYRTSGGKNIRMKELVFRGENLAICPACGSGNAMLSGSRKTSATTVCDSYKCRDCGFKVDDQDAVKIYTELDKPGMGNNSTYSEVRRAIGLGN